MTTYIVLRRSERAAGPGTVLYELVGTWAANSPTVAVRRIADGTAGEYIAVPQRNWTRVAGEEEQVKPKFTFTELGAIPEDAQLTMGAEHENDDEDALPDPEPAPLDPEPEPVPA